MNVETEILTILQEECAEVIQAVSKIKRFKQENNYSVLKKELCDLQCMMNLVYSFNIVAQTEIEKTQLILEKTKKLKEYSNIFNEKV